MIALLTQPTLKNGKAVHYNFSTQDLILRRTKGKPQPLNRFPLQAIYTIIKYKVLTLGVVKMNCNETIKFR
jgi:hypothetical protein